MFLETSKITFEQISMYNDSVKLIYKVIWTTTHWSPGQARKEYAISYFPGKMTQLVKSIFLTYLSLNLRNKIVYFQDTM